MQQRKLCQYLLLTEVAIKVKKCFTLIFIYFSFVGNSYISISIPKVHLKYCHVKVVTFSYLKNISTAISIARPFWRDPGNYTKNLIFLKEKMNFN